MKKMIFGVLIFLLGLAWVPAAHADENADYQAALGNYQKGQYDQAVIGFQNVLLKDPNSWQAYQGLGSAFLREGDKDGALQAYQRSLQLNPDNPTVKAKVDKLSAETPRAAPATPSPTGGFTPVAASTGRKIETIGTFTDQNGTKHTSNFIFEGQPLNNDQQIEDVIDLLKDDQATQLMKSARGKQSGANALDVLGAICISGALVYGVAAPATPVTNTYPFGGASISQGNPDLTPSWIAGGVGVGLLLIGTVLEGDAGNDRYQAVARYNELAGPGTNPEAASRGTGAGAAVTGESTPEASHSAPPPESSPSPSEGSDIGQVTVDISPLANLPLSGKTASEYNPGFGIGGDIKLSLDKNWSVGVAASFQDLPVNVSYIENAFQQTYGVALPPGVAFNGDWQYIPIVGLVQYSFSTAKPGAVPYVFLGAGVAINSADVSAIYSGENITATVSETDFLLCPGLGVRMQLDPSLSLFFQGRLDIDFTSQNNMDVITLTENGSSAKALGNLSDDSPTLFLPLQLGLEF